jgi:hypothetical protein
MRRRDQVAQQEGIDDGCLVVSAHNSTEIAVKQLTFGLAASELGPTSASTFAVRFAFDKLSVLSSLDPYVDPP